MARSAMEQLYFPIVADPAELSRALDEAVRKTGAAAGKIRKDLQGVANDNWGDKLGQSFDAAFSDAKLRTVRATNLELPKTSVGLSSLAKGGLLASTALAALGVAYQRTRVAMQVADEIADSATKIGVSVEALQEWRLALDAAGGDAKSADGAIQGFTKTLGLALNGSKDQLEWFGKLGIGPEKLVQFKSAEDALSAVADAIAALDTEADQQAFASKLGLEPLLPLLKKGATGIADLREEARTFGGVMSAEVIAKAAEAEDKLEKLSKVVDTQMSIAFADLAPLIGAAAVALANFVSMLPDATTKVGRFVRNGKELIGAGVTGFKKAGIAGMGLNAADTAFYRAKFPFINPEELSAGLADGLTPRTAPADAVKDQEKRLKELLDALKKGRSGGGAKGKLQPRPGVIGIEDMHLQTVDPKTVFDSVNSLSSDPKDPLQLNGAFDDGLDRFVESLASRREEIEATLSGAIEGGLQAGFEDGLPGVLRYLAQELQRTLISNLADDLASLATSKGTNGVSGGVASFVASLFGGGRAGGGGVEPGMFYRVNESSPRSEWFVPRSPGMIVPDDALRAVARRAAGMGGDSTSAEVHFHLEGAVVTQDLLDQMNSIGRQSAQQGAVGGARLAMKALPGAMAQQRKLGTIR